MLHFVGSIETIETVAGNGNGNSMGMGMGKTGHVLGSTTCSTGPATGKSSAGSAGNAGNGGIGGSAGVGADAVVPTGGAAMKIKMAVQTGRTDAVLAAGE